MRIPTKAIKSILLTLGKKTIHFRRFKFHHGKQQFQEALLVLCTSGYQAGNPRKIHDPPKFFTCLNPFVCNGAWVPGCPLSLNRSDPGEELLCGWLQAGAGAVPSCSGWRESQGPSSAPTVTHTTSAATQPSHSTTTKWADEQSAIFYQNKT